MVMIFTLLPMSAFAADVVAEGTCGGNLTWTLDTGTGELVISGTGAMNDYTYSNGAPWYSYRSSIKSITIGNSVTSIGDHAFRNCAGLTSITIPDSVTSIGEGAFYYCTGLTSVTIGNSVTSIGEDAFYKCTGLTGITIPDSVTSIGNYAFYGCTGLTGISVSDGNASYDSRNGCNALIETATNTLIFGCKNTKIPDSVTSIGDFAFCDCTGLTSVTIGNSVTSIGNYAFYKCTGLTSITIPNSVTSIGNYAFYGCTGLTSVTIGNSVTSIGEWAFSGCRGLTGIKIPNSVTSIGDYAFYNCTGLASITIGNGVTSIGEATFYKCTGLTGITIPNSVTSIGFEAFRGCTGLTGITIPDSVTSIGNDAFYKCTGLTSVTIGNSVTSIGDHAFFDCTGLTGITIGNSVTSIGFEAFRGCTGLTGITIPNSVTSIGGYAFYNCTGLTSITIPDSVTSIGNYAFYGCTGLTSITIPDSVTSIGHSVFSCCTRLTGISVSDGNARYDSRNGCNALIETATNTLISGCKSTKIPNSVTSIDYAFAGCTGLTGITIPNSVTSIGNDAFYHCTGLTSITIPNSVTSIGNDAFYHCTGLTSITIPDSVTSIGYAAFRSCTGLTSVYYTGSKEQWAQISIGKYNSALTGATIYYDSSPTGNQLYLTDISPNHTVVGSDAAFVLTFNKEVTYGLGIIEVREEKNGIAGQYVVADYVDSISIDGKKVTIDISGWLLKDGSYTATISPKAFKTKDGTYYCGMSDQTEWTFDVCSSYNADGIWEYAQKGVLWWKHDDTTKPAIPNGTDSQYAQLLLQWAKKNGINNLTEQDILNILDEPMYLPATDMNGATVLLDDKQMTVRQTLEDILFFESLKPFAEEIDDDLSDVVKFNQIEKANVNPIRMETDLYEKVLGWYPQVDKYLNRRNECNPFYSSAAPFAYQGFLTAFEAAGGEAYSYTKPLLKATLDTSIAQSSYTGLSQYAQYSDFKNATSELGFLIKTLKTEGEAAYLAKTSTDMSGSKMIVKFGVDFLRETFKYSENNTLTEISTAWDDYDSAMSAGELCAFLGSSIGAFPMVIDLYNNLDSREAHMAAAFYFVSDYYVQEKYPEVYNAVFDDTGFPAEDFDVYWFQATTGITGENDPILYNWLSYLKTISEGVNRNRCRQLRYDLVNYIMLLQYAQEFDASAAKVALLKYISAECSREETTQLYASCPVTVEVYDKTTDQLIASLSSEDEEIQSCEYGSLYLLGENNETKCFVLNSDAYYARIIPYDDGTMDVTVAVTDENGETAGKVFRNVSLTNGIGYELNLDNLESGLEEESGETIEKDSYISVNRIDIVGENEIAVGATMQLKANVYPVIATNRSLTWSSSDAAVATVDENGVVTGIGEGTAVITATSADEVTAEKTVTVFIPATELSVDTESLSMVEGESYQLSAIVSDNATHDVQWGTNNMNAVTVSADGELTARAPGSAIVTATIDGISSEVFVTVYENQLDVEMYQLDMGRNALRLVISNRSCVDDVQESAYVASYESGRQIAIESVSIDLPANGSLTTEIELPDFAANTTYSTVFYPLGERAAIMQPQELVFVNGGYDTSETTQAASGELPSCKKETITCQNVTPGEEYTVYVLTDDSGIPKKNNIVYISRDAAEAAQMSFVVCAAERAYRTTCYVYLSDSAGSIEQIGTMIPHHCSYTIVEPSCTESGVETYTCAVCGESETRELAALGHDYVETVITPSCVDQGYSLHTCSRCSDSYVDTYVDALGHVWDDGVVSKQPTATENGVKTFTCTRCGETRTEPIPATGDEPCDGGADCPSGKFVDVNTKEWYHPYVDYAVAHGLFGGTSANTFEPETAMTRAMLVTVLWRYEGEPEAGKNTFSDVPNGQWYTKAVAWAAENGIVGGVGNNRFDPDGKITREQMATILFRYAQKKGIDTSKRGDLSSFPDANKISVYAKEAIQWAVAEGIINGSDGKLLPQGSATRAQVATILMRFIENIVNK